ncbi:MAG: sulfotransferase domain-containing protein [Myxococcota bacterium]
MGIASIDRIEAGLGDLRRTAAFVQGRVLFRPRPDDLYVATYPRSGTTWMQFLLHQLARGDQPFRHINDVCPWFERSLAVGSMTAEDLERLPSPRIFKTHLLPMWLPEGGRCVYIERGPGDVALSYFRLYRDYLGFAGTFDDFLERFVAGRVQYGSWWSHVAAWRALAETPRVLCIRYEALRADPTAELTRVAQFGGLPTEPERIAAAVEGASLSRMKELEGRFDHASALLHERGIAPRSFIRQGKVGAAHQELSPQQRERLAAGQQTPRRPPWLPAFLH